MAEAEQTMSQEKLYTIRGAGLGFAAAMLAFVLTWNVVFLALVPLGAATGFALSRVAADRTGSMPGASRLRSLWRFARRYLAHPNIWVRCASLLAFELAVLLVTWTIGYYLLPEAAFRSAAQTQLEAKNLGDVATTVLQEWRGIWLHNMIPLVLIALVNLALRVGGMPLGYSLSLFQILGYGLFLGTNSFLIPYPQRLAPTLAIMRRAGPYEMVALALVAAATARWSLFEMRDAQQTELHRVPGAPGIKWMEVAVALLGVILLAGAAWIEASMIVARG